MNANVKKVLIIGGGFSGMAAAIELRKIGIAVDLVEIDPGWRSYGAGITISGPTLRAFKTIGIIDEVMEKGACTDGIEIRLPHNDQVVARIQSPRCAGPDIPGGGGIMRPVLAGILAEATRASGTQVRLGCTFSQITQDANQVTATFTDGSQSSYDLLIGADGFNSATRKAVFPDAPEPRYTGQSVWRAIAPRGDQNCASMYMGKHTKAGFNPISKDTMYMFVTQDRPTNTRVAENELIPQLTALLQEFAAPLIREVVENLGPDSLVNYRPLEGLLLPRPWYQGRVLLIGDAVHATTPHLASGAGIGVEDAIVIAEEIAAADNLAEALESFQERRWERCRMVVENSLRLGEIEATGGDQKEHEHIMMESIRSLTEAI